MRIEVDKLFYAQDYGILGRVGEREFRTISCTYPHVEGAQIYKLRFEISDDVCYELDVTTGTVQVPPSLLMRGGLIRTQFLATAVNDSGSYDIIAKSNVFYCIVEPSIESIAQPIPTYEQSQDMLERILGALSDYEAKSKIVTAQQFADMAEHYTDTVYYVTDGDKVSAYLGDAQLYGGSGASLSGAATYRYHGSIDTQGTPETE